MGTVDIHRDMEIVTWVLAGRLEHRDSEGNHGELYPGLAQRMSAGTGIEHSEMNPSPAEPVHFVQMWVPPDTEGVAPGYEQHDVNGELEKGGLRPIASSRARRRPCRTARTCICSSRRETSTSRKRASSPKVTRPASRAPAPAR